MRIPEFVNSSRLLFVSPFTQRPNLGPEKKWALFSAAEEPKEWHI